MNAADIAAALGEARPDGQDWRCRCPICGKTTLALRDNPKQSRIRLLINCWNGCKSKDVRAELGNRNLRAGKENGKAEETDEQRAARRSSEEAKRQTKINEAMDIWRSSLPADGQIAETYLASRLLLHRPVPPALRFTHSIFHPREARTFPALIALVQHKEHGAVAIHASVLNPLDPTSKLTIEDRKFSLGPVKGAAVRLFPAGPELAIGEGIEDCLAFQQATGIPAWAVLGDIGIANFVPPPVAETPSIILIEDQDEGGRKAVANKALALGGAGYKVRIARPIVGKDINEALLAKGLTEPICTIEEIPSVITIEAGKRHVAADHAIAALEAAKTAIYQRNASLVRVALVKAKTSGGDTMMVPGIVQVEPAWLERELGRSAVWQRYDERKRDYVRCDPPPQVAMAGHWPFPPLYGIIQCPTLRADGTLLDQQGYDDDTGLVLVGCVEIPPISMQPGKQDAEDALGTLCGLLSDFSFVDAQSKAVALSMLITPVIRGALAVAPMHLVSAPLSGSGKSYLLDCAAMIATGERCAVEAMAPKYEETEKRLIGAALAGFPIIAVDDVREIVAGDFFCQVVERPLMSLRALGSSTKYRVPNSFTIFADGNNATVAEDMIRRTIRCNIDANCEYPEERAFTSDPLADISKDRGRYIAAALTIPLAYLANANRPKPKSPLSSFGAWCRLVRDPLLWLGCADPVARQAKLRNSDPRKADTITLFESWKSCLGLEQRQSRLTKDMLRSPTSTPSCGPLCSLSLPNATPPNAKSTCGNSVSGWQSTREPSPHDAS